MVWSSTSSYEVLPSPTKMAYASIQQFTISIRLKLNEDNFILWRY